MTQKIVINNCFGGFGLSEEAIHEVARRKGLKLSSEDIGVTLPLYLHYDQYGNEFCSHDLKRDDSDLVAVVEEMGEDANDGFAELKIVEIPDNVNWQIEEYDGAEWVAEQHRTWS